MNKVSDVTISTLAPGKILPVKRPGDFFYFIEATGPLSVRTNRDDWKPFGVGRGLNWKTREFKWTEIRNDSAVSIRFAFYSGYCQFRDRRLNAYGGDFLTRTFAPILPMQQGICSTGSFFLEDGEEYTGGIPGVECRICPFPLDGGTIGVVKDGVIIDVITASQMREIKTSGEITFRNISGSEKLFVFFSNAVPGYPCPTPPPEEPPGALEWEYLLFDGIWVPTPAGVVTIPPGLSYEGGGLPIVMLRATNMGAAPVTFTGSAVVFTPSLPPPSMILFMFPSDTVNPGNTIDFSPYNSAEIGTENGNFTYVLTVDGHITFTVPFNFTYSS